MADRWAEDQGSVAHCLPLDVPSSEAEFAPQTVECVVTRPPDREHTLGALGVAARVAGEGRIPRTLLVQRFTPDALVGIDAPTVRVFRVEEGTFHPVWRSGINVAFGYTWAKIDRPGVYAPIGIPRDRLLQVLLRDLAIRRRYAEPGTEEEAQELAKAVFGPMLDLTAAQFEQIRTAVTGAEARTAVMLGPGDIRPGGGGHLRPFPLPNDQDPEEFRERLARLRPPAGGLPEEKLFDPPERLDEGELPWRTDPRNQPVHTAVEHSVTGLLDEAVVDRLRWWFPWFFSPDWWMYQHDERHTGHASGWSGIRSTTVSSLAGISVAVDGPVITKPSIADGKVYIGTGRSGAGAGGTLYKIDLATGAKEGAFPTFGTAFYSWYQGIGGSPAIVGGRAYFTGVHGKVYCVDTTTMTPEGSPHPAAIWETNLKAPDPAHHQPVNNPGADSWSGPLVVNGRVYVGCGEGESAPTYGFVFCLDAATGSVLWLFCTSKFTNRHGPGSENTANAIPASVAVSDPLPGWASAAGFTIQPDPVSTRSTGCSVWSSCAYDPVLDRIYVGTGNSAYATGTTAAPDQWYGSGLLCLDATTGAFHGFHNSASDDSYWPGDVDIDVSGAPTVFTHHGQRLVGYGCKNGSYFVLDAATMAVVARRQLLSRTGGSGLPGDRGTGIPAVVPTGGNGENSYGIMGTAALDRATGRLFVGLGGYNGMAPDAGAGMDQTRVPFLRALRWTDLHDAWPTAVGADNVSRYTTTKPPMYSSLEVGLSSPAVVHDVVFVATNKAGLYALDRTDGHCLWAATGLPTGQFCLGPAVSGDSVVIGAGPTVYIYSLGWVWRRPLPPYLLEPIWRWVGPWPPPPLPWREPTTAGER